MGCITCTILPRDMTDHIFAPYNVVNGLVSAEKAREIYKVAIAGDQTIDEQATRALRQAS